MHPEVIPVLVELELPEERARGVLH